MSESKGTFRRYIDKNFRQSTLDLIGAINVIVEEYEAKGFSLTVRQIHYQFVSRGWLPNTPKTYNQLQSTISDGRVAGLISWTAVEDRGRALMGLKSYTSPSSAVAAVRENYRVDMWAEQPWRPEVWVEKQALEGVIGSICNDLRIDYYACKGYNSQSMQWEAGQRFAGYVRKGQRPIVFHLGDHDPSGIDMTRDNRERLSLFAGVPITLQRLALNMNQVEEYAPPPNYAKLTDSRIGGYQEMMEAAGHDPESSWELDALDPTVIHGLIKDAVDKVRDTVIWDRRLAMEVEDKRLLDEMIEMMGGGNDGTH